MNVKVTFLFCFFYTSVIAQPSQSDVNRVMTEMNKLRSKGCKCGSQWMPPVGPLIWDKNLYLVSNKYARYMEYNRHFDHVSKEGEDLGDRLNKIGYRWQKIGENLAYGYHDFFDVLRAWIDSPSHCKMLMDPDVTRMGLSKHKIYWVQSFSKKRDHISSLSSY